MTNELDRLRVSLAGRYAVERELGRGGMATVYLAHDLKHDRNVAVKVLREELALAIGAERFHAEIRTTANLQHPHVLPLYDSGDADGFLYFVMPYVPGESLRARLGREGHLSSDEVVTILSEVADALAYAHDLGIVHRDIKPDNVLISGRHVLVTDFGVAKAVSGAASSSPLTSAGISLGTPTYMAPEQAAADPKIDHRADLYALGVMGYELLAGQPPFAGESLQGLLAAHLTQDPKPLSKVQPAVPAALSDVVMQCLEKKPVDRWQRADDVRRALAGIGTPGTGVATAPGWQRRRIRRWRWILAASVVVVLALFSITWVIRSGGDSGPRVVAVVPLVTIGGDESAQAFASGLAEVLASRLTELLSVAAAPMWVIPPSEIRDLEISSAAEARKELNVTLAVTGSLQPVQDELQLTLNLIDAASLRQLRSTVLRAPASDVIAWQDGVVERTLAMLDVRPRTGDWELSPEGGTGVASAYQLYVQGRGHLQLVARTEQDIDAAIDLFSRAAKEDSAYALAFAGIGEAYWYKYRATLDTQWVAQAIASSQRALALTDSLPQVWATLAIIQNGMGRHEEALASAQRALDVDPSYADGYMQLAAASRSLQRLGDAETALQQLIDRRPYHYRAYSSFAYLRFTQGRYAEAADLYRQAGDLAPGDPDVYRNAGAIYFLLDRWPEAREMFERSVAAEVIPGAVSNLGTLDYFEGDYASAAQRFREAIDLRQRDFVYWRNLGDAYRQMEGHQEDTRAAYERSLELGHDELRVNPADLTTRQNIAFVAACLGDSAQALDLVDGLEREVGDDADMMFSLTQTLEEVGERDRALHWLRESLSRGYALRMIENEPQLANLRRDPRYAEIRRERNRR